jgi:hypothetical protein
MAETPARTKGKAQVLSLIGSDKAAGAPVYSPDGRQIGTIERLIIDKISGKIAYAVTTSGSSFGMLVPTRLTLAEMPPETTADGPK